MMVMVGGADSEGLNSKLRHRPISEVEVSARRVKTRSITERRKTADTTPNHQERERER